MKEIKIDTSAYTLHTPISNIFIEHYMPHANGDFVKVYLYIVKSIHTLDANLSLSYIADSLHLTETDVNRAIRYWCDQGLLNLEMVDEAISTLHVLTPTPKKALSNAPDSLNLAVSPSPMIDLNHKPTYPPSKLKELSTHASIKQLIYVTQKYLGKMLTQNELGTLISFVDWLKLPYDVIEYLIEYCVSNNHRSMRYIEKVAITWAEEGLDTIDKVQQHLQVFNKHYFAIMKAFGLINRNPALTEIKFMKKWLDQYQFDINIVLEACNRTIQAIHQPSFDYADSILESWHKAKVASFEDIKRLDSKHQQKKQKNITTPTVKNNRFMNHPQRDYDFEDLKRKAREKLIKQTSEDR